VRGVARGRLRGRGQQLTLKPFNGTSKALHFAVARTRPLVRRRKFPAQFRSRVLESLRDALRIRRVALCCIASLAESRGLCTKLGEFPRQCLREFAPSGAPSASLLQFGSQLGSFSLEAIDFAVQPLCGRRMLRDLIAEPVVLLHQAVDRRLQLIRAMFRCGDRLLERMGTRFRTDHSHRRSLRGGGRTLLHRDAGQ